MAKKIDYKQISAVLAGVGAVNWGLVEFVDVNLVEMVAGLPLLDSFPTAKIVIGAITAAGAYLVIQALN